MAIFQIKVENNLEKAEFFKLLRIEKKWKDDFWEVIDKLLLYSSGRINLVLIGIGSTDKCFRKIRQINIFKTGII